MGTVWPAEVFQHGEGQAVSIPPGLMLPSDKVTIRQDGVRLVIEPVRLPLKAAHPANQPLLDLLATLDPIDEEFPEIEDHPPGPFEL